MIKFIVAALWICAATAGAVFFSFQTSNASSKAAEEPNPAFGGLDYIKADIMSVPLIRDAGVHGYLLTQLVYTVDPKQLAKLSIPASAIITDEVYSYLYSHPQVDFTNKKAVDLDAFRNGIKDAINKRVNETLIHEVLVEQFDFLSKDEIRDNLIRRKSQHGTTAEAVSKSFNQSH
jgi:flagellar basal body-associated protein FliL